MPSVQQELREILDALEARGFTARNSDGHYKIFYGNQPVMWKPNPDEDVTLPVTLPGTPSDVRWRENVIAMLIRAKLLDDDPKKAGQRGLTPEDEERRAQEREERERRQAQAEDERARQSADDREQAVATARLKERAERVLGNLGVWKLGTRGGSPVYAKRTVQEAGRVALAWADDLQIEHPAPTAVIAACKRLYEGDTVDPDEASFISTFLATIEASSDPVDFYFGLLRELLGLKTAEEGAEPEPEPEPAEPSGAEPLETDAEDDLRVRDLREALAEARREADERAAQLREAEREAEAARAEAREAQDLAAQMEELAKVAGEASQNGHEPRIPELAFEVLGEMLGSYVTVAGDDDGANLGDVMRLLDVKREKAVTLAKRVAALEVGVEVEA